MKLTQIEHIGIALKNMEESIELYKNVMHPKCYLLKIYEPNDKKRRRLAYHFFQPQVNSWRAH